MFRRILIANRGEIALRVARACRKLGVESVIVHSEADSEGPWLEAADRTICIGPAAASASYLDQDAVLQAAEQSDCQAIHPGYGFLSENATFAARCEQQGITFIGAPASSIDRMGDKAVAKATMAALGLPTIPGSGGVVAGVAQALQVARQIGFPVLLKASAGGGGKGMRLVRDAAGLPAAFDEAALEAAKAFGNPDLYVEKWIDRARHVEFQLLVDVHGHAIHLGERECSIQRNHQKLLEEAPSPAVDAGERARVGADVARVAAACGYRGAGTVEFLRAHDGAYYFMEMNTRLQVEHPVTEALTGIDLVEQQLRIAANEPLGLTQNAIAFDGHAIELRINAEDVERAFRPDPGTIAEFIAPVASAGVSVRWDSAVRGGYRIPPHYDSMIGKLIVRGATRELALDGAIAALDSLTIVGVKTTVPLHRKILGEANFRRGEFDTRYLERHALLTDGGA